MVIDVRFFVPRVDVGVTARCLVAQPSDQPQRGALFDPVRLVCGHPAWRGSARPMRNAATSVACGLAPLRHHAADHLARAMSQCSSRGKHAKDVIVAGGGEVEDDEVFLGYLHAGPLQRGGGPAACRASLGQVAGDDATVDY